MPVRHDYSKTSLICSCQVMWIRYALSDVLINRQWQMSDYRLTGQKNVLIPTQTHTQTSFVCEQAAQNLLPWRPCGDDGILKLIKAVSQFLLQAPLFCERPHDSQRTSCVGYRRAIIHVIHDDDMEVLEAMVAGNASLLPCFDDTVRGNCSPEKVCALQFC